MGVSVCPTNRWQAQGGVDTRMDRYPGIYAAAAHLSHSIRTRMGDRSLRLLSFGCSTGEECFSLRAYFPDDEIFGCDINTAVLATARRRQLHGGTTFFHSSDHALRQHGPFDMVFCMSSLCLFPESDQPSGQNGAFPFPAYDALLTEIDRSLMPGGLLVIYNASYPFRLSTIGPHYNVVQADVVVENGFVNKLHRSGHAFTVTVARNQTRCHKMVSGIDEYRDSDFVDCLFHKRDESADDSPITLSPALAMRCETLSRYTLSDEDAFPPAPDLLTTAFEIELLRDPSGMLFERIEYRRRSIFGGTVTPTKRFVRMAEASRQK
jgi:SAM-dependent methyltransferase